MEAAQAREADRTSFRTWVETTFGPGVARHFMRPYNEKMWTVPLERLTCDWIGYIPKPSEKAKKDVGYNQYFWYPREGGCGALTRALAREAAEAGEIEVGERVAAVHTGERWVETASGRRLMYRSLVSSIPLPVLVEIDAAAPADARAAAGRLEWVSVYNLNLGVAKETRVGHWAYFAEPEYVFYRVGFYHTFSETMAPPGHSSYYVEVSYSKHRPLSDDVDERIHDGLRRAGLLDDPSQIVARLPLKIAHAYGLQTPERRPAAAAIRAYLKDRSVEPVGRYGRWEYTAIEEALVEGRDAARRVREALCSR
jgi:protoporphyrinogen oxidase